MWLTHCTSFREEKIEPQSIKKNGSGGVTSESKALSSSVQPPRFPLEISLAQVAVNWPTVKRMEGSPFIQQTAMKLLLCARHDPTHWQFVDDQDRQNRVMG